MAPRARFAQRYVDPHVDGRAQAVQPVRHTQKLELIAQPLFANQQEPAARHGLTFPFRKAGANQIMVLRQRFMPSVLLPALLEIAKTQLRRREIELHARIDRAAASQPRWYASASVQIRRACCTSRMRCDAARHSADRSPIPCCGHADRHRWKRWIPFNANASLSSAAPSVAKRSRSCASTASICVWRSAFDSAAKKLNRIRRLDRIERACLQPIICGFGDTAQVPSLILAKARTA